MDSNAAEAEIRSFFETAWASLTEIAWPDVVFSIPDGDTWVRFTCQENEGKPVSMGSPGSNRFRQYGIVTIQVFQPQGQGSKDARAKAATAATVFKGAITTNGVTFTNVYSRNVGPDGNGYYQINVVASFYYDELT